MTSENDLTRPEGLYQQIASRLRAAINLNPPSDGVPEADQYWPGDALPSEIDLARRYRVSRQTVRSAIAVLVAEGLLAVEHGKGTFVRVQPVRLLFSRYARHGRQPGVGLWESTCAAQGISGRTKMIQVEPREADMEVAQGLDVPVGTAVIYRHRHMHAGDEVAQIQEAWLPMDLVAGTRLAGTAKCGTYAALDRIGHGPARITENILARPATHGESLVFDQPTAIVMQMTRRTYDAEGRIVEWLKVAARADRTEFVYKDLPLD